MNLNNARPKCDVVSIITSNDWILSRLILLYDNGVFKFSATL